VERPLEKIRRSTRADVEKALFEAKATRTELERQLREVQQDIALAEAWLGQQKEPGPRAKMTLQDAMRFVLEEDGNRGMAPGRLAEAIAQGDLYRKRDGSYVGKGQIQARVSNYPHMFVRENGRIRLREAWGRGEES
jgi:hypothetical protein